MSTDISFCPLCAGKLDAGDEEQFACEDCETQFFIQVLDEGDDDDDDEEDEEEADAKEGEDDDEEEETEEEEDDEEY